MYNRRSSTFSSRHHDSTFRELKNISKVIKKANRLLNKENVYSQTAYLAGLYRLLRRSLTKIKRNPDFKLLLKLNDEDGFSKAMNHQILESLKGSFMCLLQVEFDVIKQLVEMIESETKECNDLNNFSTVYEKELNEIEKIFNSFQQNSRVQFYHQNTRMMMPVMNFNPHFHPVIYYPAPVFCCQCFCASQFRPPFFYR